MNTALTLASLLTLIAAGAAPAQETPSAPPATPEAIPQATPPQAAPLGEAELRERMAGGNGSLAIRAIQGTPYGNEVGIAPVEIILVHRGQVVHNEKTQLDEHGVVVVEGLPVAMEVTPIVQVNYSGVFYQETGPNLTPQANQASIEITVYDTTDQRPDWSIAMRHVMIEKSDKGLLVSETVVTSNEATQTWLGQPVDSSPDAKRTTAEFQLPAGAQDVQLVGGFHGWCCTTLSDSGLLGVQMPMMPGRAQYRFSYLVPVKGTEASLALSAPVRTDHVIAFMADDGTQVTTTGMTDAGAEAMGDSRVRLFQAEALAANQIAGLSFAGLAPAGSLQAVSSANSRIKLFAAVGAGVLLLAGIVVVLMKAPRPAAAAG